MAKLTLQMMLTEAQSLASTYKDQLTYAQLELEKERKLVVDAKSARDYYSRQHDECFKELSALHTILDFLPGAPPRKTLDPEYGSSQPVPLVARFAAFLATKS